MWAEPTTAGATLTFDADPLTEEQLVAGPIAATMYARSTTKNLNLIATLYDVPPSGTPVIFVNPAVYAVAAGNHLRLVLSTQAPASKCESLLSALGIVLPCLPTDPQKASMRSPRRVATRSNRSSGAVPACGAREGSRLRRLMHAHPE
jgi:hypothetical protein